MGMIDLFIDIVNVILDQQVEGAPKPFFLSGSSEINEPNEVKQRKKCKGYLFVQ
jgi:hypothetical protein